VNAKFRPATELFYYAELTCYTTTYAAPVYYYTEAPKYYTEATYYTITTVYYTEAPKYYAEPSYYITTLYYPSYFQKFLPFPLFFGVVDRRSLRDLTRTRHPSCAACMFP
jgi:hypothetical protein